MVNRNSRVGSGDKLTRRTTRIWVTLPEGYVFQMDAIISNPRTRYQTRAQFVDEAILKACELEAKKKHAGMLDITVFLRGWRDTLDQEANMNLFRDNLLETCARVAEYRNTGMDEFADSLIQRTVDYVNSIPDGMWKRKFIMDMRDKLGYIELKAKGLRLLDDVVDVPTPGEDVP